MALKKVKLGDLLELCDERNSDLKYDLSDVIDAYNKFGKAKGKRPIPVIHKPGNENKHLHKYRDVPFSLLDFL